MICSVLQFLCLVCLSAQDLPATAGPPAERLTIAAESWVVFAAAGCKGCRWLKETCLPGLKESAGTDLPPVLFVDLDAEGNYEVLMDVEEALEASGDLFPALLVGKALRYGEKEIARWAAECEGSLPSPILPNTVVALLKSAPRITLFLERGGVPPSSAGTRPGEIPQQPPADQSTPYADAAIIYFETTGCKGCARAEKLLAFLQRRFPHQGFGRVNALEPKGRLLQMAITTHLGLPAKQRLQTPMFTSGNAICHGETLTDKAAIALVKAAPAAPFWQSWNETEALAAAERDLHSLVASFTVPAVLLAGLIDGVNPCAFAVIIFLVSYLTLTQGMGKTRAFCYGVLFCAGVFLSYFLIGIGFSQMLEILDRWSGVLRSVFVITAAACFVFAIGAGLDVIAARRRGTSAMRFGMPKRIRNLTHRLIRERVGTGLFGAGAFALGVVVSGLELVCTGQVYLPVIVFINSSTEGRAAIGLLCAYNLAFIAPLLAVVCLGVFGVGSKAIAGWAGRHAILMRGLTGGLVLALGIIVLFIAFR